MRDAFDELVTIERRAYFGRRLCVRVRRMAAENLS